MKVALFTDSYFPQINGVTYSISLLKKQFFERGLDVTVVFPKSSDYLCGENEIGIKSFSLPFYEGYRVGFPEAISDRLGDLDVVHTHTQFSIGGFGAYIARKKNAKHINTLHTCPEYYVDYITSLKPIKRFLKYLYIGWEKRFLGTAEIVTVPSKEIKKDVVGKGLRNVKVVPNAIDLDFFNEKKDGLFSFEKPVIGYSGRHSTEKNLEDLIEVSKRLDGYTVAIAGDGPCRERYESMAKNLDNVVFLGWLERDKLPYFYSTLDVFVFPSIAETQGLVALESNACGTPVVGANCKGLKNNIIDGKNGYLYTPGDIDMLENKIKACIDDEELVDKSKNHVEKYSSIEIAEEIIKLYQD
ncbi:Glycosyltransferase, AglL family [Methanonatronarchaeum thermophilum]|uniref:Glycosyltransferase, AglL family n=1 Tax=Methanonatronarchaeum thermophilum TaxID=1927129 RepID=A0A1Y3GAL5_9EURY|nr:glycosyltransferase [Methanonatronarchaeum thermophilum]OUJ18492.1 Glycosyltransferase, AglL family [Methanonatronarchaeum thermophilum]